MTGNRDRPQTMRLEVAGAGLLWAAGVMRVETKASSSGQGTARLAQRRLPCQIELLICTRATRTEFCLALLRANVWVTVHRLKSVVTATKQFAKTNCDIGRFA